MDDYSIAKLAVECFQYIMIFMGDFHGKKTPKQAAVFITELGMKTEGLRDELFCQIIKQITSNKSQRS